MQTANLVEVFLAPLEKNKISYFVTGSVASIFYGEPRLTHDVDLVVHLKKDLVENFVTLFPLSNFYCPPAEVIQIEMRRKPFGHFNLIHHATGFKADLYTSSDDELHSWALQYRRRVELTPHLSIWVAPPEYVIIRKLEFYREGRSDKHLTDIRNMLAQIESTLNKSFLDSQIAQRGLNNFAKKVF